MNARIVNIKHFDQIKRRIKSCAPRLLSEQRAVLVAHNQSTLVFIRAHSMAWPHNALWLIQVWPANQICDLLVLLKIPDQWNMGSNPNLNRVYSQLPVPNNKLPVLIHYPVYVNRVQVKNLLYKDVLEFNPANLY